MQRNVIIFLLFSFLSACSSTTIYVVRHAEKQVQDPNVMMLPNDVELSQSGHARAAALADSLRNVTLHGIFATTIKRTQQTAAPTASRKGLPVITYAATQPAANALMDSLSTIRRKNFLVAGHSNTVPEMIRHLGLTLSFEGNIPDDVYNKLFVITIKSSGGKSVNEKTY
jgi:phosphohistidine phosphatase SixA